MTDSETDTLVMKAQSGLAVPLIRSCARVIFGKCLCGRAALTQEIQFSDHIDERHDILYEGITPHGHYCIPFTYSGNTLGVITLYVKEGHSKNQNEILFLTAIANTLSSVVIRKKSEESLRVSLSKTREALHGSILALSSIVEKRDPYTAGHQKRVSQLAQSIAVEMNLDEAKIACLRVAGILHDIGKIAVPSEILCKPGRLSEIEFGIIKVHPQASYETLKMIEFPWPVAETALQHHERLNGSGYPNGISCEKILLEAKILAVADTVEAMSSHRPYRPSLGINKALEEIAINKDILFDASVVDACLRLFQEKRFEFK